MATSRANVQQSSMAALPVILGILGGLVAVWFRYPGMLAIWLGFTIAAWIEPPAVLTGTKVAGRPTPIDESEDMRLEKFRFWSALRFAMLPGAAWSPGWPLRFSWFAALFAGLAVWHLPVQVTQIEANPVLWPALNAIALFATIAGFTHAKRVNTGSPGVTIDVVPKMLVPAIVAGVAGAAVGIATAIIGLPKLTTGPLFVEHGMVIQSTPLLIAALGGLGLVGGMGLACYQTALAKWKQVYERRREWTPRWRDIKQEPAPQLIDTENVGPFVVDTFEARGAAGDILKVGETKITPAIGAGVKLGYLTAPNIKAGQPVPGTVHPNRFVIASCDSDQWPNTFDEAIPEDVRLLAARTEWQPRWKSLKADPAPELVSTELLGPARIDTFVAPGNLGSTFFLPLTSKVSPFVGADINVAVLPVWDGSVQHPINFRVVQWSQRPDVSDPNIDPNLLTLLLDCQMLWTMEPAKAGLPRVIEVAQLAEADGPTLWGVDLDFPTGPGWKAMRRDGFASMVAEGLGSAALVDHTGGGAMYFGDVENAKVDKGLRKKLNELASEDRWAKLWSVTLKQGKLPPTLQHAAAETKRLPDGTEVHRYAFAPLQGIDPTEFFGLEPKLSSSLVPSPFLTISGWQQPNGRPGDRHPQLFAVYHSKRPVAVSPDVLGWTQVDGQSESASKWVLRGMVSKAFVAARRSQPEVVSVRCLTAKGSRSNIWQVDVRLFGGDTLADIRGVREKLRQSVGAEWLRISEFEHGVSIFMGADPANVRLADPKKDQPLIDSLNWTQGFIDAGVTSRSGLLPQLTGSSTMEKNAEVKVLDFVMPPGIALVDIREKVNRLKSAVGCEFLSPMAVSGDPNRVTILAAKADPMPRAVAYDYEYVANASAIPFGEGVDGEPVIYDWKNSPHLLISGGSGSGKLLAEDTIVPVPLSEKFPTGFARWDELSEGDLLYSPTGGTTAIVKCHQWLDGHPLYRITTDTGQTMVVGANHLFRVSSAASRKVHGKYSQRRRDSRHAQEREALVERLTSLADNFSATDFMPVADIEEMAGLPTGTMYRFDISALAKLSTVMTNKRARLVSTSAVWHYISGHEIRYSKTYTLAGTELPFGGLGDLNDLVAHGGEWLTAAQIADTLMRGKATREQKHAIGTIVRTQNIATRDGGTAPRVVRSFPVREVLLIAAEAYRNGSRDMQPLETVQSVKDMFVAVKTRGAREATNFALRVPAAVKGTHHDLPIDPWVFGAWLGDGTSAKSEITVGSEDVEWTLSEVQGVLPEAHLSSYDEHILLLGAGTKGALRTLGALGAKHIPALYMTASREQRLALLQGLMDTDGTIGADGCCELTLSDEQLAADALMLIRSLGIKASLTTGPAGYRNSDGERVECKDRNRIHFTTTEQVFRMPRKMERIPATVRDTQGWLYITSIEPAGFGRGRCITVDDPMGGHLGADFMPTHNSAAMQMLLTGALVRGAELFVGDPMKGAADFKFAEPWCRTITVTIAETAAMMRGVYAEVERRKTLNSQYGTGSYRDLPEDVRPPHVIVIIDEFTSLIELDRSAGRTPLDDMEMEAERLRVIAENSDRTAIGQFVGKIAREARSAGVTMWLGAQKLTSKSLDAIPGGDSLKINMARLVLGVTTFGERMSALRLPEFAPDLGTDVPIGRGMFESSVSSAIAVHTYWDKSSNLAKFLEEQHVKPAAPFNLAPFIRKTNEDDGPGVKAIELDIFGSDEASGDSGPALVDDGFTLGDDAPVSGDGGLDLSALVVDWGSDDAPLPADDANPFEGFGDDATAANPFEGFGDVDVAETIEPTTVPVENPFEMPEQVDEFEGFSDEDEALLSDFASFDTETETVEVEEPTPATPAPVETIYDDWGFDDDSEPVEVVAVEPEPVEIAEPVVESPQKQTSMWGNDTW